MSPRSGPRRASAAPTVHRNDGKRVADRPLAQRHPAQHWPGKSATRGVWVGVPLDRMWCDATVWPFRPWPRAEADRFPTWRVSRCPPVGEATGCCGPLARGSRLAPETPSDCLRGQCAAGPQPHFLPHSVAIAMAVDVSYLVPSVIRIREHSVSFRCRRRSFQAQAGLQGTAAGTSWGAATTDSVWRVQAARLVCQSVPDPCKRIFGGRFPQEDRCECAAADLI